MSAQLAAISGERAAPQPWVPSGAAVLVRPARPADMLQVEPLINHFAEQGLMLPKTREQLVRHFREFVVAIGEGGALLGCGALRVYSGQLAEISSLAVDESAQGLGVGRKLITQLEEEARALEIGTVFALTLQEIFFHRLGYRTVPKEMFPPKVWADCRNCAKLHACNEIAVVKELDGRG